jgi:hypothetical protein
LGRQHAVYDEMRAKGLTDYVAWPLYHTLGKRHIVTFATDRAGGFDDAHIAGLKPLLPVLALVSEIRMKNRLARTPSGHGRPERKEQRLRTCAAEFRHRPPCRRRHVLLSRAFADFVERDIYLEHVGEHLVRGFSDPIELFAYNGP